MQPRTNGIINIPMNNLTNIKQISTKATVKWFVITRYFAVVLYNGTML